MLSAQHCAAHRRSASDGKLNTRKVLTGVAGATSVALSPDGKGVFVAVWARKAALSQLVERRLVGAAFLGSRPNISESHSEIRLSTRVPFCVGMLRTQYSRPDPEASRTPHIQHWVFMRSPHSGPGDRRARERVAVLEEKSIFRQHIERGEDVFGLGA